MLETLQQILRDSVSAGFGTFMGYVIIMSLIFVAPIRIFAEMVSSYLRHRNIVKNGWPPEHCDADGNAYEELEEEEDKIG